MNKKVYDLLVNETLLTEDDTLFVWALIAALTQSGISRNKLIGVLCSIDKHHKAEAPLNCIVEQINKVQTK